MCLLQLKGRDVLKTLDDPRKAHYKDALVFLLDVDWVHGLPKRAILQEGPACWAKVYGMILGALSRTRGGGLTYPVCDFLKRLPHTLQNCDSTIYSAPEGLETAISSSLKLISRSKSWRVYDSLKDAYVAIRQYYHIFLVKKNLDGDMILSKIFDMMRHATQPLGIREGIGRFMISQIPPADQTQLYLIRKGRSNQIGTIHKFDDFTCEQIVKLGDVGLEALATYATYYTYPYAQAAVQHVRKFLDQNANHKLDKLIEDSKRDREDFEKGRVSTKKDDGKKVQTEKDSLSKKSDDDSDDSGRLFYFKPSKF